MFSIAIEVITLYMSLHCLKCEFFLWCYLNVCASPYDITGNMFASLIRLISTF